MATNCRPPCIAKSAKTQPGARPWRLRPACALRRISAASSLEVTDRGTLMNETRYIEHAQTPEALTRLTAAQAKKQWDLWAADPGSAGPETAAASST